MHGYSFNFALPCLLLRAVIQMSDVAIGPLILIVAHLQSALVKLL